MMTLESFSKISLNICSLELWEEFPRDSKNEFESATVNEPSAFESLKVYFITVFEIKLSLRIMQVTNIYCRFSDIRKEKPEVLTKYEYMFTCHIDAGPSQCLSIAISLCPVVRSSIVGLKPSQHST